MNKLQLYITKSAGEFKNILNLNPDEDVRRCIVDVRRALSIPRYDPVDKCLFYMVKYVDSGSFIGVLSTICNRHTEHVAAWIYVPYDLIIKPEDLLDVVKFVAGKISGPSLNSEDLSELRAVFGKQYESDPQAPAIVASRGTEYAFRYFGGDCECTLRQLLGEYLYQTDYLPYAGVLMVDAADGIECRGNDLTDAPMQQMVELLPPEEHPDGFKPYIFGELFDITFLAPLHQNVEIVWKRPGFEDARQSVYVERAGMQPTLIAVGESKKTVSKSSFSVTSLNSRKPITDDCTITVNGRDVAKPQTFTLEELANAAVTVTCDGYEPYSSHINLASSTRALIQMRERGKVYNFEISAKSSDIGGMIHFEIRTTSDLTESPIDGYELIDDIQEGPSRSNHLVYDGGDARKALITKILWAIGGFLLGVIVMLLTTCSHSSSENSDVATTDAQQEQVDEVSTQPVAQPVEQSTDKKKEETPKTTPAPQTQTNSPKSLAAAVLYLDNNRAWHKDSIDSYPDLRGLFEDMNNLDRQKLVEVWGPKLKESRQFKNVATHAEDGIRKKHAPRIPGGNRKTYNPEGDKVINVQGYLNCIDP